MWNAVFVSQTPLKFVKIWLIFKSLWKTRGFSHGNDVLYFSRTFLRQHKNIIILENFLHLHVFLERSGIPTFDTRATTWKWVNLTSKNLAWYIEIHSKFYFIWKHSCCDETYQKFSLGNQKATRWEQQTQRTFFVYFLNTNAVTVT